MNWFSEYRVRTMAEAIAPRIEARVEAQLVDGIAGMIKAQLPGIIRAELPGLLMAELRREMPESTPKNSIAARRERDSLIRSRYNGRNAELLAGQFGISASQVRRIVQVGSNRASSP